MCGGWIIGIKVYLLIPQDPLFIVATRAVTVLRWLPFIVVTHDLSVQSAASWDI